MLAAVFCPTTKTNKMHNHKFFKVEELVNNKGEIIYEVSGAENKLDVIMGTWFTYATEHNNIDDAVAHIKRLYPLMLKSKKTVYKTDINNLSANGS
jgi:hypothetical protein